MQKPMMRVQIGNLDGLEYELLVALQKGSLQHIKDVLAGMGKEATDEEARAERSKFFGVIETCDNGEELMREWFGW